MYAKIDAYIQNYISQTLDTMIDEKINVALTQKLQPLGEDDVRGLFDQDKDGILDFLQ